MSKSFDFYAPAHYDPSARRAKLKEFLEAEKQINAGTPPSEVGIPSIAHTEPIPEGPAPIVYSGKSRQ